MSDKREAARLSMLGHLPGEIMVLEPMLVAELSRSGATIETRFPLQLNSLHDLRLTLRPRPVVIKGRVQTRDDGLNLHAVSLVVPDTGASLGSGPLEARRA